MRFDKKKNSSIPVYRFLYQGKNENIKWFLVDLEG